MKLMLKLTAACVAGLFAASTAPALAAPAMDCPLRDAPFSASSPLIDIMLSPAARAVVERRLNISFDKMSQKFVSTQPPTFAAILTLKQASGMLHGKSEALGDLDAALRKIPVTAADKRARCARYDNDRPTFDLAPGKPRLLLFEKINGFKDAPGFDAADAAFRAIASRKGWTIVATDKGGAMNPATLRRFDAVIWNNVSGDVLTLAQRRAFRDYIEAGGASIAVHGSAGDPVYFWDWYVDELIGARFIGHPLAPQFQSARVVIEPGNPVARGLPSEWTTEDEWYSFAASPRLNRAKIIATLDEATYSPKGITAQDLRMGDHPIAWIRCVGKGRSFYSAIGHRPEQYSDPRYVMMLENAIEWATITGKPDCGGKSSK